MNRFDGLMIFVYAIADRSGLIHTHSCLTRNQRNGLAIGNASSHLYTIILAL
jgi:hypothetical protein